MRSLFQTLPDTMELEFVSYEIREPNNIAKAARIHDASYSAPIFVTFRLINKGNWWTKTQEVFFGDFPIKWLRWEPSSSTAEAVHEKRNCCA